jgi:hypothetical protein
MAAPSTPEVEVGPAGDHSPRVGSKPMDAALRDAVFALGPHIRYVAFGSGQHVDISQREGVADASEARSDFFEELLVNPVTPHARSPAGRSRLRRAPVPHHWVRQLPTGRRGNAARPCFRVCRARRRRRPGGGANRTSHRAARSLTPDSTHTRHRRSLVNPLPMSGLVGDASFHSHQSWERAVEPIGHLVVAGVTPLRACRRAHGLADRALKRQLEVERA